MRGVNASGPSSQERSACPLITDAVVQILSIRFLEAFPSSSTVSSRTDKEDLLADGRPASIVVPEPIICRLACLPLYLETMHVIPSSHVREVPSGLTMADLTTLVPVL